MSSRTGVAIASARRTSQRGGTHRQPPKPIASPTASAGRKAAVAGLIGSAALTAAGLATFAAPTSNAPATTHVAYTAGNAHQASQPSDAPVATLTSFSTSVPANPLASMLGLPIDSGAPLNVGSSPLASLLSPSNLAPANTADTGTAQNQVFAALTPSGQPSGPPPIDLQPGDGITAVRTPNGPAIEYEPADGSPPVIYGPNEVVPLTDGSKVAPTGTVPEYGGPAPVVIPAPTTPSVSQDELNQMYNNQYQEAPVPLPRPRPSDNPSDEINTNPYEPPTDPGKAYVMNNSGDGGDTSGTPGTTTAAAPGSTVAMGDVPDTGSGGPTGGNTGVTA